MFKSGTLSMRNINNDAVLANASDYQTETQKDVYQDQVQILPLRWVLHFLQDWLGHPYFLKSLGLLF